MDMFGGTKWRGDTPPFDKDKIFSPVCTFGVEAGQATQVFIYSVMLLWGSMIIAFWEKFYFQGFRV